MAKFKELDPEVIKKLLEGQEDLLTKEVQKEEAFFKNSYCPKCKSIYLESFVDPNKPFISGSPLPNKRLKCIDCRTEFNPYTKLILSLR